MPSPADVLLSIIVPVYNQERSIVGNLHTICESVRTGLNESFEIIVVSDGSIDRTDEELVESHIEHVRFLRYDRNLGKGYAIKVGALDARGRWIAYVDADLDLDPSSLPEYVAVAERDGLDFAIGSKRHPDSVVSYPVSRRVASWLFQRYVKLLLQLDVRDTQVGIKVFRREVADQVLPLLLVKRYAFDIELLAVAHAFGFSRVRELPVTLGYKFSGSGVRLSAVVQALVDTLAVFYRLRILHTYQRKRALVGPFGWTRPANFAPSVALLTPEPAIAGHLDWPNLDVITIVPGERVREAAQRATAELVAVIEAGAVPSGNFVSATVPFLAREGVGAVVTSKVAPATGSLRARAAAAVRESRIGGGSLYFRYMPGNIRYVTDFPTASFVVRRLLLLEFLLSSNRSEYRQLSRSGETWWSTRRRRSCSRHPNLSSVLISGARWPTASIAARRSPGMGSAPCDRRRLSPHLSGCSSSSAGSSFSSQERRRSGRGRSFCTSLRCC